MKRRSLIFLLSAWALVAQGCSSGGPGTGSTGTGGGGTGAGGAGDGAGTSGGNAGAGSGGHAAGGAGGSFGAGGNGTGGKGGAAGSGAAGKGGAAGRGAGGGNGGTAGSGSVCPGAQQLTTGQCRSVSDCPSVAYFCTLDPAGVLGACATPFCATTPVHECTVDTDCPTGDICITSPIRCCTQTSTTCHVSCNAAGVTCAAGAICSPGTRGADDYGCAPMLCNAGYICPTGFACAVGVDGDDAHGCRALPCSRTGCPANFVCQATATAGGCTPKPCSTDCDCDAGFCVGGACASHLATCVIPPA
jgi:hypothetical protein